MLTLPCELRARLAYDGALLGAVCHAFVDSVLQCSAGTGDTSKHVQNTDATENAAPAENTGAPAKPALDRTEAVMLGSSSFNQAFGRLIEEVIVIQAGEVAWGASNTRSATIRTNIQRRAGTPDLPNGAPRGRLVFFSRRR